MKNGGDLVNLIVKILIDTNVFLDFYRSKNDSINILSQILDYSENIILTEQIVNEFYRSRTKLLREIKQVFEKESTVQNITSAFLDSLDEFATFQQLHFQYFQKKVEIRRKIDNIIFDISIDPVALEFKKFVDKKINEDSLWKISNEAISNAQKRKLLGNPPRSDKYSIGDEINWEIILENSKEDIIIVGRDRTYNENFEYLRYEYHKNTGKFINKITSRISEAFSFAGQNLEELTRLETNQIEELKTYSEFWKH